ncbi:MAG: hypothetical protein ACLPV8_19505 [Steroidobacteraceae bacterium]
MALDKEQPSAAYEMRGAVDWLRDCADLAGVDAAALEALAPTAVHFSLPAGHLLFESGASPDGVYLVASADILLKPPLADVELLNRQAFDRTFQAGYDYARSALEDLPATSRLMPAPAAAVGSTSLADELQRRLAARLEAG